MQKDTKVEKKTEQNNNRQNKPFNRDNNDRRMMVREMTAETTEETTKADITEITVTTGIITEISETETTMVRDRNDGRERS